jgi:hypothetical protein
MHAMLTDSPGTINMLKGPTCDADVCADLPGSELVLVTTHTILQKSMLLGNPTQLQLRYRENVAKAAQSS